LACGDFARISRENDKRLEKRQRNKFTFLRMIKTIFVKEKIVKLKGVKFPNVNHRQLVFMILNLFLFIFSACAPYTSETGIKPEHFRATAAAANELADFAVDATREATLRQTAVAANLTAVYSEQIEREINAAAMTRDHEAMAATMTRTHADGVLSLRATEMSLNMTEAAATSTAVYHLLRTEEELKNADQLRQQQAQAFANDERVSMLWTIVIALGVLCGIVGVSFAIKDLARGFRVRQERPLATAPLGGGDFAVAIASGWTTGVPAMPRLLRRNSPATLLPANVPSTIENNPSPSVLRMPSDRSGHVMVVGATGKGKSNTLRVLATQRDRVIAIDPHFRPESWPTNVEVKRDPNDIKSLLDWMQTELDHRIAEGAVSYVNFETITVIVDELPALANRLGTDIWNVFSLWLWEARKYKLFLIVGTHTTLVRSLGLQGQSEILENFHATYYLGAKAIQQCESASSLSLPAAVRIGENPPEPVLIPYEEALDPDSRQRTTPRILPAMIAQEEIDGRRFDRAVLSDLTSRNKAALWLVNRETGRASGQEYARLDAALEWRKDRLHCLWAEHLLQVK
jgi:hypothetical protein